MHILIYKNPANGTNTLLIGDVAEYAASVINKKDEVDYTAFDIDFVDGVPDLVAFALKKK